MRTASLAFLLLLLGGTFSANGESSQVQIPEEISLLQLIATPERYDGKLVAVTGFLCLEFEGNILYLHEEDYKQKIPKNGVRVEMNPKLKKVRSNLDMSYVHLVALLIPPEKGT